MFSLLFIRPVLNYSPRQLVSKLFEALGFGFSVQEIHSNDTWKPCKVFVIFTSHCPLEWRGGEKTVPRSSASRTLCPSVSRPRPSLYYSRFIVLFRLKKGSETWVFGKLKHIIIDHSLFVVLIAALVWLD